MAHKVALDLVPQGVRGGGWSSSYASCLRTSGVGSFEAGLATIQVIRSGMFLPPPKKKRKKEKKEEETHRGLSQMVPASENATVVLSPLLPVLLWSVLWSLLRSARLAIWVQWKVTDSNVCFHMLMTAVPAKLCFAPGKIALPVPCTGTF